MMIPAALVRALAASGLATDDAFAVGVQWVLGHEGVTFDDQGEVLKRGESNDPRDPGGYTNWGISLRAARALHPGTLLSAMDLDRDGTVSAAELRALPLDKAVLFYKENYWDRTSIGRLSSVIAVRVFDAAVNMGSSAAIIALQRASRAMGGGLAEDGQIGPKTISFIASIGSTGRTALLAAYRSELAATYRLILQAHPEMECYRQGWLNRAYDLSSPAIPTV